MKKKYLYQNECLTTISKYMTFFDLFKGDTQQGIFENIIHDIKNEINNVGLNEYETLVSLTKDRIICISNGSYGYKNRVDEPRFCHCLAQNFKSMNETYPYCSDCCIFPYNHPLDNFKVTNLELNIAKEGSNIGAIDLMIEYENEEYAVEVKAFESKESVLRMALEIYTYSLLLHRYKKYKDTKIGIFLMKYANNEKDLTIQYKQLFDKNYKYYASDMVRRFISYLGINVFVLDIKDDMYHLERANINE